MARAVEFLAEAVAESVESRAWYDERDPSLGIDFARELNVAVDAIAEGPDRWPLGRRGTRRYLLRRFPFTVVYTHDDEKVRVIAVAHLRRKPGYWEGRT